MCSRTLPSPPWWAASSITRRGRSSPSARPSSRLRRAAYRDAILTRSMSTSTTSDMAADSWQSCASSWPTFRFLRILRGALFKVKRPRILGKRYLYTNVNMRFVRLRCDRSFFERYETLSPTTTHCQKLYCRPCLEWTNFGSWQTIVVRRWSNYCTLERLAWDMHQGSRG